MEWEKKSANYLINDIQNKELLELNKIQLKNGQDSPADDVQVAYKLVKRCSTLSVIRGMQVKTTVRYVTSQLQGWLFSKNFLENKCW